MVDRVMTSPCGPKKTKRKTVSALGNTNSDTERNHNT